ncbi:IclR family transcriptional regulator [Shumkonia mesophila]|uniref:IclR family transcriptional regulator n=1 Tax=Shumkonia mesophila TaxID=2838854 RepID=UPI0029341DA3|nr:IclR family transcriptional regulator [Shumkonia mesophila]
MVERRDPTENEKNKVRSAAKVLGVLAVFQTDEPELSLPEIAARAGIDRGTAFRLVHTLVSLGFLRATSDNKRFRLTLKCLQIGYNALMGSDLREHAFPILRELVPEIADAASYGVLDRDDVVYIVRVESGLSLSGLDRRPGTRTKAYAAALGHAMLAFLPRQEQIERLNASHRTKFSERTLVGLEELLVRLEAVRSQGYAVSDGENAFGLRTVAAPVLNADGVPVGGISLTITSERMGIEAFVERATPAVLNAATELSDAVKFSFGRLADGQFSAPSTSSRR